MSSLDPQHARGLVERFTSASIAIVGDVMLDEFLIGRVNRISPEAPVPVVEFDHEECRIGGAANVANNVRALGGRVDLVGVIGNDATAERLKTELRALGIEPAGLVADPDRRTTKKLRIVTTRNQQVARVDYETDAEVSGDLEAALADRLEHAARQASGIVVSDYLKGVITRRLMARIVACGRARGIPILIDPKIPHVDYYAGATLITPNHHEAEIATHVRIRTTADAQAAARLFQRRAGCDSVLMTHGEHGMWLLEGSQARGGSSSREPAVYHEEHLPALAREVADVTGAGDTVIATMALGLASGARVAEAARLANQAAGISVGKFGPATVTPQELMAAVSQGQD